MTNLFFARSSFRIVLAFVLSFSLLSFTAGAGAYPPYPGSQRGATTAAQAAGKASLNFPPDRKDQVAQQCDQLADNPTDPQRVGDGIAFNKIEVDQALDVCRQAAERQPARPRYQYLYGRVLATAQRYPDAAAQYAAADRAGYTLASFSLAGFYRDALGVDQDWEEARRLYFRAGNAGIAEAFADGGLLYTRGDSPHYVEAKSWFEHAVQGGSAEGYANLGWLYEAGYGVNPDPARALGLFNEAAKRGSAEGMYRMGVAYYDGLGVQKDPAGGCRWFIQAAKYGHPNGQEEAGRCYYNGIGVDQDHEAAYNWFVHAGQAGLADARVYVADMFERGDGHGKDPAAAVMWYQAAAEQGDVYAMTQLGAHLRLGQGVGWSEAKAMEWFAMAAQQKYVPAETSLAVGYENGLGQDAGQGRQDYQQAAYWFGQAAGQGDGYAQLNLGVMYEKGWGMDQDLNRAKQLYAQAAASDNREVADLGRQYFSSVPASASPDQTPARTRVSDSSDSTGFWTAVIVGGLAIGLLSSISSGGSKSGSSYDGGYTDPHAGDPWWERDGYNSYSDAIKANCESAYAIEIVKPC